jgi:hypothetical protein
MLQEKIIPSKWTPIPQSQFILYHYYDVDDMEKFEGYSEKMLDRYYPMKITYPDIEENYMKYGFWNI